MLPTNRVSQPQGHEGGKKAIKKSQVALRSTPVLPAFIEFKYRNRETFYKGVQYRKNMPKQDQGT